MSFDRTKTCCGFMGGFGYFWLKVVACRSASALFGLGLWVPTVYVL